MKKWLVKSLITNVIDTPEINEMGVEGWELVAVEVIPMQLSPIDPMLRPLPVFFFRKEATDDEAQEVLDNAAIRKSGKPAITIVGSSKERETKH